MHSHHSHSGQFCRHAKDRLEDVVQEAIRQGFVTYGLSEHCPRYRLTDLYPEEEGLTVQDLSLTFETYLVEAARLKGAYAGQIKLLIGLELEFIRPEDTSSLQALIAKHKDVLDYIVGSVHHVRCLPVDFDLSSFNRAVEACGSLRQLQMDYFDAQYEMMQAFRPEIIGHLDLCRLFTPSVRLDRDHEVWQRVERNIDFAIDSGALIEINSAAIRKGWETPYPGEEVLKLIQAKRGRFCLSDDSHGVDRVGLHYTEVKAYLERLGVDKLFYLSAQGVGYRAEVKEYVGDWRAHPFWQNARVITS